MSIPRSIILLTIQRLVFDIKTFYFHVNTFNCSQQTTYQVDGKSEKNLAIEKIKKFLMEPNVSFKTEGEAMELKAGVITGVNPPIEKKYVNRASPMVNETTYFYPNTNTETSASGVVNRAGDTFIQPLSLVSDYYVSDTWCGSGDLAMQDTELSPRSNNLSQDFLHPDNTTKDIWSTGPYDFVGTDTFLDDNYLSQTPVKKNSNECPGSSNYLSPCNQESSNNFLNVFHNIQTITEIDMVEQVDLQRKQEISLGTKRKSCNLWQNNTETVAKVPKVKDYTGYNAFDQQNDSIMFSNEFFKVPERVNADNNTFSGVETFTFNQHVSSRGLSCQKYKNEGNHLQHNKQQNNRQTTVPESALFALKRCLTNNDFSHKNKKLTIKNKFRPSKLQIDHNINTKLTTSETFKKTIEASYIKTPISDNSKEKESQSTSICLSFSKIKKEETDKISITFIISKLPIFLKSKLHIDKVGWNVKNSESIPSPLSFSYRPSFSITAPLGADISMLNLLPDLEFYINNNNFFHTFYTQRIIKMRSEKYQYNSDGFLCSSERECTDNSEENKLKKKVSFFYLKSVFKRFLDFKTKAQSGQPCCDLLKDIISRLEALIVHLDEMGKLDCTEDNLKVGFNKIYKFEEYFIEDKDKFKNFQGQTRSARFLKIAFDMLCYRFYMHKKSIKQCLIYINS
ncbi:hypothetical protein CDIK_1540 [Cucumispora dikerogammari]|nr:hypothetical protein CDIK_1540 [Cucumispora dikerogammari]